jgi:hypothetical protein
LYGVQGVAGSNPVHPTKKEKQPKKVQPRRKLRLNCYKTERWELAHDLEGL